MVDFQFYNPCRILFGKDNESKLPELIRNLGGSRVLMHYGGGSIKKNGVYDKVTQALKDGGIEFYELGGVQPNPRLKLVREGIALCKEKNLDFILAVGGGSVIDSSKAISVGVYQDDVWDCFVNGVYPTKSIPVGVVLTIPAAGSESSDACVITNDEGQLKRGLTCECIYPKFALLNPEYTYSMPKAQIANGACDIMAQLFERYFTNVEHVELTDRLIESALKTMMLYVPRALKDPTNYDIRAEILWTGTVAHNNLLNTGRIGDWASHNIEHELSGMYDIAHGAGLAIIFPAWMKYCAPKNKARFAQFARRIMDIDLTCGSEDAAIAMAIEKLENFNRSIGLPVRLSEAGIGEEHLREMAEKAVQFGPLGNFKLTADDIYNIYKLAL